MKTNAKSRGKSPYAADFKSTICSAEHDLLSQRFLVTKLTRKDLEDKYLVLCDENFALKKENNSVRDKMKRLMVQLMKSSNQKKSMSIDATSVGSMKSAAGDGNEAQQNRTDLNTNELLQKLNELSETAKNTETEQTITHCHCACKDANTEKRIHDKMKKLNKELEAERERNKQLEKDIRSIEHAMIKQNVAANMDIIALKQKIDKLEKTVAQMRADKKKQDGDLAELEVKHQAEIARLKLTVQHQNDELEKLETDLQEHQSLKRLTKQMQEDATNMERENQSLKLQHENFTTLLTQSTLQNSEISALKTANDKLQNKVTAEQSTIDIVGQQQVGLLEKLKKVTDEADLLSITNEGLKAQNEFLLERFMQLERTYEIMRTEQETIEARVFSEIDPKTIVVKETEQISPVKIETPAKFFTTTATQTGGEYPKVQCLIEESNGSNLSDAHLQAVNKARHILVNDILTCQPSTSGAHLKKTKFAKKHLREDKLKQEVEQLKEQIRNKLEKRHISFLGDQGDQRQTRRSFIRDSWLKPRRTSSHIPLTILPGNGRLTTNWVDLVNRARAQSIASTSEAGNLTGSLLSNTDGQISIEIISLKFREDSGIFDQATIRQIYVEYNFLGYAGHLLETPQSIAITSTSNERLVYNFRNTFDVESGYDSEPSFKASILLSMLMPSSKNLLKFICVNEPTEEDLARDENAECSEIGYGAINLGTLMRESEDDKEELFIYVFSTAYPHKHIGKLHVAIEGFKFMNAFFAASLR